MVKTRRTKVCYRSNKDLPNLPREVIIEILSWLPAKRLWCFRFVSKSWFKLLTTDLQFTKLHSDRSIQTNHGPSILALQRKPSNKTLYLAPEFIACHKTIYLKPPIEGLNDYTICGICNGLLCLLPLLPKMTSTSALAKNDLYIWNPLTGDHITVPYPDLSFSFPGLDPRRYHVKRNHFAFGFHQGTNEYKVVSVYSEICYSQGYGSHAQLGVYTLGKDSSWRIVEPHVPCDFHCVSTNNRLVNGVLHWIAYMSGEPFYDTIVGIDLKDEVLRHILPPSDVNLNNTSHYSRIEELGGLLSLFTAHGDGGVQVWVMKEYGIVDSWTKQFIIQSPEVCQSFNYLKPLGAYNEQILFKIDKEGLILYNIDTDAIVNLKKFGFQLDDAYTYIGSIISPRVISRAGHIIT